MALIDTFTIPCFNPVRRDFARGGGVGRGVGVMLNIRGGVVMRFLGDFLGKLLNHQRGATAIEYALIAPFNVWSMVE